MRRNRCAVLCGALALTLLCGCGGEQDASQRHSVALVVKSTQSECGGGAGRGGGHCVFRH